MISAPAPLARILARVRSSRPVQLLEHDRRAQLGAGLVAVALAALAVLVLLTGGTHRASTALPPTPPSPVAPHAHPSESPTASRPVPRHATCRTAPATALGGTAPQQLCVPAIGIDTSLMQLGLNPDRTVQVPPLSEVRLAGWYKYSATPGAKGPMVILGHIDSAQFGDGVFYHLGDLRSSDRVRVTRDDGAVATYRIYRVSEVPKTHFPTMSVYGPTRNASIRLITCGGKFDAATGNYLDNIIAYGTLSSLRHPSR